MNAVGKLNHANRCLSGQKPEGSGKEHLWPLCTTQESKACLAGIQQAWTGTAAAEEIMD